MEPRMLKYIESFPEMQARLYLASIEGISAHLIISATDQGTDAVQDDEAEELRNTLFTLRNMNHEI